MLKTEKKIEPMHDAWHVLIFNPFFWEQTGKKGLMLRQVCKSLKKDIPERLAIDAAFGNALVRKVDVYRLFPLSVNDVVRLRSPLRFMDAFRLAERKTGGFDFCMAVIRDKGWALWNSVGVLRGQHRAKLLADLRTGGVSLQETSDLFEAAVAGRRQVDSAVVWRCVVLVGVAVYQYDDILHRVRNAVGFWYKGINRDVRSICDGIERAKRSYLMGRPIVRMHHQHIACGKFVFGVVDFRPYHGLGN